MCGIHAVHLKFRAFIAFFIQFPIFTLPAQSGDEYVIHSYVVRYIYYRRIHGRIIP